MKTQDEILKMLYVTLAELESGTVLKDSSLHNFLCIKLGVLYEILGETVPENYWERIEKFQ